MIFTFQHKNHNKMKRILFTPLLILLFLSASQAASSQEIGMASYYADKFQGRSTASGEKYDKGKMTCAHRTYTFGTLLKVTRLDNQKSVVVRVNDRGPHVSGRVVDVSKAAAKELGMLKDGVVKVKVEVYKPVPPKAEEEKPKPQATSKPKPNREETPQEYEKTDPAKSSSKPAASSSTAERKKVTTPNSSSDKATTANNSKPKPAPQEPPLTPSTYKEGNGFYHIQITTSSGGFATQVAVYSDFNNAMKEIAHLQSRGFKDIYLKMETAPNGPTRYKLLLGLRKTREEAEVYRKNLYKNYRIKGFVTEAR